MQSGFLSILYSIGSKPLQLWDKKVANGHVTRLTDEDIQSSVLELVSANVATTYITCPADNAATLGVKLPYLVMVVSILNTSDILPQLLIIFIGNRKDWYLSAFLSFSNWRSSSPDRFGLAVPKQHVILYRCVWWELHCFAWFAMYACNHWGSA